MAQGPILIFDKSSLESPNLDQAVLLDSIWRYGSSLPTRRRARLCQAPRAIPA